MNSINNLRGTALRVEVNHMLYEYELYYCMHYTMIQWVSTQETNLRMDKVMNNWLHAFIKKRLERPQNIQIPATEDTFCTDITPKNINFSIGNSLLFAIICHCYYSARTGMQIVKYKKKVMSALSHTLVLWVLINSSQLMI